MKVSNSTIESGPYILQRDPIVLVCAADDKYAMPLAVTVRSALANLASYRKILLFIIDGGITNQNKRKILRSLSSEQCEVKWIPKPAETIHDEVVQVNTAEAASHISIATWYRLLIPELLPQQFTKAIYLDCDLIVTENLGKLWDIDIEDNYLLAVTCPEAFGAYVSSPRRLINWKELGFSEDCKYFNAGVLVLNLVKWRSDNMCSKALNYIAHNQKYIRWVDQDVLNAVIAGQWGELDPRWNLMEPKDMPPEKVNNAFIIHFTSAGKPWIAVEKYLAKDLFYYYLDKTNWSGYRHTLIQRVWRRLRKETNKFISPLLSKIKGEAKVVNLT